MMLTSPFHRHNLTLTTSMIVLWLVSNRACRWPVFWVLQAVSCCGPLTMSHPGLQCDLSGPSAIRVLPITLSSLHNDLERDEGEVGYWCTEWYFPSIRKRVRLPRKEIIYKNLQMVYVNEYNRCTHKEFWIIDAILDAIDLGRIYSGLYRPEVLFTCDLLEHMSRFNKWKCEFIKYELQ